MNEAAEHLRLPPLHAPEDRELLAHVGPWQVRRHTDRDERFAYLVLRAFLHLQLWRPDRQISVLTPSRLTRGRFEIAVGWRRAWISTWPGVVAQLPDHELRSGSELAALTMWLVVRSEIVARRSSAIDAGLPRERARERSRSDSTRASWTRHSPEVRDRPGDVDISQHDQGRTS